MNKNRVFLFLLLFPTILLAFSCQGNPYVISFEAKDIESLYLVIEKHNENPEIREYSDMYDEFYQGIKELNYKSYVGQIKGKELQHFQITLKDGTKFRFEPYFVVKNNRKMKFNCDAREFLELFDLLYSEIA